MAIIPADEKVFMVDKRTNTTYGGSQALQDMQQWYTMQDVADSVQTYKVFTALLTQNGGSAPTTLSNDPLTIGVTYKITDTGGSGWDFTNVGAPNNNVDTYFIATGTTPNSWDGAILELNEGAPTVIVLENTIGNVWFVYDTIGRYILASNELFLDNKTAKFGGYADLDLDTYFRFGSPGDGKSVINLSTGDPSSANGYLQNTTIEVRVYN